MKPIFTVLLLLLLTAGIVPVSQAGDVVLNQNLEYINTDLRDVIRDLAELGGFRVILDRQVQGEVTLTLVRGVTAKEAIITVARGYGYSSRWLNASALMVGTSAFINGNFAARSTRLYTLKAADPVLTAEILQTVIPQERIQINQQTKELTISADIAEHQNITDLINRLDRKTPPINLEIRVEEITESLWKELQLETDFRPTEMGGAILNSQQIKILQDNSNRLLLSKPGVTCYNYQEARVLVGDYLSSLSEPKSDTINKNQIDDLETGTRLIFTPSLVGDFNLSLKMNVTVKNIINRKSNTLRSLRSRIGLTIGQTILFNGILQRNEYLEIKKSATGLQFPILEDLFLKNNGFFNQPTRIVILVTPHPGDGINPPPQAKTEKSSEPSPVLNSKPVTQENLPAPPAIENKPSGTAGAPNQEEPPVKPEEVKPEVVFDAVVVPESQPEKPVLPATPTQAPKFYDIKYTVKKGDTPTNIAKKFGIGVSVVLAKNGLTNTDKIKVDSILLVPVSADRIYVVKSKETLWRIAKRYGTTLEILKDLNGIDDETKVKEGQELVLPGSSLNVVNPQF